MAFIKLLVPLLLLFGSHHYSKYYKAFETDDLRDSGNNATTAKDQPSSVSGTLSLDASFVRSSPDADDMNSSSSAGDEASAGLRLRAHIPLGSDEVDINSSTDSVDVNSNFDSNEVTSKSEVGDEVSNADASDADLDSETGDVAPSSEASDVDSNSDESDVNSGSGADSVDLNSETDHVVTGFETESESSSSNAGDEAAGGLRLRAHTLSDESSPAVETLANEETDLSSEAGDEAPNSEGSDVDSSYKASDVVPVSEAESGDSGSNKDDETSVGLKLKAHTLSYESSPGAETLVEEVNSSFEVVDLGSGSESGDVASSSEAGDVESSSDAGDMDTSSEAADMVPASVAGSEGISSNVSDEGSAGLRLRAHNFSYESSPGAETLAVEEVNSSYEVINLSPDSELDDEAPNSERGDVDSSSYADDVDSGSQAADTVPGSEAGSEVSSSNVGVEDSAGLRKQTPSHESSPGIETLVDEQLNSSFAAGDADSVSDTGDAGSGSEEGNEDSRSDVGDVDLSSEIGNGVSSLPAGDGLVPEVGDVDPSFDRSDVDSSSERGDADLNSDEGDVDVSAEASEVGSSSEASSEGSSSDAVEDIAKLRPREHTLSHEFLPETETLIDEEVEAFSSIVYGDSGVKRSVESFVKRANKTLGLKNSSNASENEPSSIRLRSYENILKSFTNRFSEDEGVEEHGTNDPGNKMFWNTFTFATGADLSSEKEAEHGLRSDGSSRTESMKRVLNFGGKSDGELNRDDDSKVRGTEDEILYSIASDSSMGSKFKSFIIKDHFGKASDGVEIFNDDSWDVNEDSLADNYNSKHGVLQVDSRLNLDESLNGSASDNFNIQKDERNIKDTPELEREFDILDEFTYVMPESIAESQKSTSNPSSLINEKNLNVLNFGEKNFKDEGTAKPKFEKVEDIIIPRSEFEKGEEENSEISSKTTQSEEPTFESKEILNKYSSVGEISESVNITSEAEPYTLNFLLEEFPESLGNYSSIGKAKSIISKAPVVSEADGSSKDLKSKMKRFFDEPANYVDSRNAEIEVGINKTADFYDSESLEIHSEAFPSAKSKKNTLSSSEDEEGTEIKNSALSYLEPEVEFPNLLNSGFLSGNPQAASFEQQHGSNYFNFNNEVNSSALSEITWDEDEQIEEVDSSSFSFKNKTEFAGLRPQSKILGDEDGHVSGSFFSFKNRTKPGVISHERDVLGNEGQLVQSAGINSFNFLSENNPAAMRPPNKVFREKNEHFDDEGSDNFKTDFETDFGLIKRQGKTVEDLGEFDERRSSFEFNNRNYLGALKPQAKYPAAENDLAEDVNDSFFSLNNERNSAVLIPQSQALGVEDELPGDNISATLGRENPGNKLSLNVDDKSLLLGLVKEKENSAALRSQSKGLRIEYEPAGPDGSYRLGQKYTGKEEKWNSNDKPFSDMFAKRRETSSGGKFHYNLSKSKRIEGYGNNFERFRNINNRLFKRFQSKEQDVSSHD